MTTPARARTATVWVACGNNDPATEDACSERMGHAGAHESGGREGRGGHAWHNGPIPVVLGSLHELEGFLGPDRARWGGRGPVGRSSEGENVRASPGEPDWRAARGGARDPPEPREVTRWRRTV